MSGACVLIETVCSRQTVFFKFIGYLAEATSRIPVYRVGNEVFEEWWRDGFLRKNSRAVVFHALTLEW